MLPVNSDDLCKILELIYLIELYMNIHNSHLPKQGYKPKKNEQFLKYQKIECSYHRHSENSFKNFFC